MSEKSGPNWAFKIMSIIHDNPLRRKLVDPYEILKEAGLKPGQKVLEVGPGPGFFTIPAAKIVTELGIVYAIDVHPLAIERVKNKIKKEKITNVRTILASATDTGLSDESIDLTYLFGLPRLIGNKKLFHALLDELYRVLRTGGVISIQGSRISKEKLVETLEVKGFTHLETRKRLNLFTKKNAV